MVGVHVRGRHGVLHAIGYQGCRLQGLLGAPGGDDNGFRLSNIEVASALRLALLKGASKDGPEGLELRTRKALKKLVAELECELGTRQAKLQKERAGEGSAVQSGYSRTARPRCTAGAAMRDKCENGAGRLYRLAMVIRHSLRRFCTCRGLDELHALFC